MAQMRQVRWNAGWSYDCQFVADPLTQQYTYRQKERQIHTNTD